MRGRDAVVHAKKPRLAARVPKPTIHGYRTRRCLHRGVGTTNANEAVLVEINMLAIAEVQSLFQRDVIGLGPGIAAGNPPDPASRVCIEQIGVGPIELRLIRHGPAARGVLVVAGKRPLGGGAWQDARRGPGTPA